MRRWWLVLLLLLSLGLNIGIFGTVVLRQLRDRRAAALLATDPVPTARLERLAGRFGLAGDDRRRFAEIQQRFFATVRRERRAMEELRLELRREITGKEPDRDRVEELIRTAVRHQEAIELAFAEAVLRSRELIDDPLQERRYMRFMGELHSRGMRPGQGPPRRRP